jgi:predicted solute-binding protein
MAGRYHLTLDDVEALNRGAEAGAFDIVKISAAAYGRIRDRYALLRGGGAAGVGVGPQLGARAPPAPRAHPPRLNVLRTSRPTRPKRRILELTF